MNEEQEQVSQLSALYDGELSAAQAQLVLRRTLKDARLQASWSRYALMGAVMRGEPLAVGTRLDDDLAARVSAQLAAVPAHVAAAAEPDADAVAGSRLGARPGWVRGAWGTAIAAGVAAASLLVLRLQGPGTGPVQVAAQDGPVPAVAAPAAETTGTQALVASNEAPPSYTTPVDESLPGRVGAPLVNYVVAHSDLPGSVVRFSPLSSVVSASYDPAEGAVEMSEAEIGALR